MNRSLVFRAWDKKIKEIVPFQEILTGRQNDDWNHREHPRKP